MIRVAKLQKRLNAQIWGPGRVGLIDLWWGHLSRWAWESWTPRAHWIQWLAEVPSPLQEDSSLPFPVKTLPEVVALQDDDLASSRSAFHHVLSTGQTIVSSLRRIQVESFLVWEKIAYTSKNFNIAKI